MLQPSILIELLQRIVISKRSYLRLRSTRLQKQRKFLRTRLTTIIVTRLHLQECARWCRIRKLKLCVRHESETYIRVKNVTFKRSDLQRNIKV